MPLTLDQQKAIVLARARARAAAAAPSQPAAELGLLDTAIDAARSIPGGLAQGVAAVGGMGADIREAWASHLPQGAHDVVTAVGHSLPSFLGGGSTSDELNNTLSYPTGGYYKPQTTPGRVAETAASYVPSAVGGEGSVATRLLGRALAPAAGTVLGGDAADAVGAPRQLGELAGTVAGGLAGARDPRKLAGLFKSSPASPTIEGLKKAASAAYDVVDNSGMIIDKNALATSAKDLEAKLAKMGIDADAHPWALKAFQRIANAAGQNQTFQGMDILRRAVSGFISKAASAAGSADDKRIARIIQDHLDDFVENISPKQVIGAVDKPAIAALGDARSLYARAARAQTTQDIIDKATIHSGSSQAVPLAAAIRNGFKKLLLNDRGISRFNAEERAAISRAANGGPIELVARTIGKLSPDHLLPGMALATGIVSGAGVPALAAAGAGIAGRLTSNALTSRNARLAKELMLRGRTVPPPKPSTLQAIGNISPEKLAAFLMTPAIASTRQTTP